MFGYAYERDPIGPGLDRSREGSVEIIELADLIPGSATANAVTHINGIPSSCNSLSSATIPRDIVVGTGGLSGKGFNLHAVWPEVRASDRSRASNTG